MSHFLQPLIVAVIDSSGTVFGRFRSVKRCSIIFEKKWGRKTKKESKIFYGTKKSRGPPRPHWRNIGRL